MKEKLGQAVEQRLDEGQTGRLRAGLAAGMVGIAAAITAYKFLRGDAP